MTKIEGETGGRADYLEIVHVSIPASCCLSDNAKNFFYYSQISVYL